MRTHCEFRGCGCLRHVGSGDGLCGVCLHASCWHKNDGFQFKSNRATARRPVYEKCVWASISATERECPRVGLPQVPPLSDVNALAYCVDIIVLPV